MKNYNNTIIYKLFSKRSPNNIYIGHTTVTLKERFYAHKYYSYRNKSKLYTHILEHGGIEEWSIELIEEFSCNSLVEAKEIEASFIKDLKPSLNSNIPNRGLKEWRKDNKEKYNNYMKMYMRNYTKK